MLINRLSTLSHPQRMAVFRLLMRRYPDHVPAGEIAAALHLKPSTTSVYLSALLQAGLIAQRRAGTRLLYAVNLVAARDVVAGLFLDCCQGRADLCPPEFSNLVSSPPQGRKKQTVLFICSGNSARSIMAEAILRDRGRERFTALSAGTAPRGQANPLALEILRENGHDVTGLQPKSLADHLVAGGAEPDFVLTLCDAAANEECPSWPRPPVSGHWGLSDPARTTGTAAQQRRAFQQTYDVLRQRIDAFTSLPLEDMDRIAIQKQVDALGQAPKKEVPAT